jgi:hypothetical protein
MKGPGRALAVFAAASALLLAWLYGGDLLDFFRARQAPVAAFTELPNVWFAAAVVAATLSAAGAFVVGLAKRRGPDYRGYRLLPIVALVSLFIDLFALSASKVPIGSADHLSMTLQLFQQQAQGLSTRDAVSDDPAALSALLPSLGEPPYLLEGRRAKAYHLQVRSKCDGPAPTAPGTQVGTLIYCVAADRQAAWTTVVALPAEERFGDGAVFTRGGQVQAAVVTATPPEEP